MTHSDESETQIQVLSSWQAIRRRPDMYLGRPGEGRLLRLLRGLLEMPKDPSTLALRVPGPDKIILEAQGTGISVGPFGPPGLECAYLLHLCEFLSAPANPLDSPPSVRPIEVFHEEGDRVVLRPIAAAPHWLLLARSFSRRLEIASIRAGLGAQLVFVESKLVEPARPETTTAADHLQTNLWPAFEFLGDELPGPYALADLARDVANGLGVPTSVHDYRQKGRVFEARRAW